MKSAEAAAPALAPSSRIDAAEARAEAAERLAAELRSKLAASEAGKKLACKRAKRDVSAAGKRALQAARSHGKASKRKAIAAREWKVTAAERKEARLEHSGKRPAGEPLHSTDRKRRRLLDGWHAKGSGGGGSSILHRGVGGQGGR